MFIDLQSLKLHIWAKFWSARAFCLRVIGERDETFLVKMYGMTMFVSHCTSEQQHGDKNVKVIITPKISPQKIGFTMFH